MKLTYLDTDTREVIDVVDDPTMDFYLLKADEFAACLGAKVIRLVPSDRNGEWTAELNIPENVRRLQTPLPGDHVRFAAKFGYQDKELSGVFLFKRGHSYVVVDNDGAEWQLQSIWQMKKV
jgi:hypothetical protein